jgi:hypothetical protein
LRGLRWTWASSSSSLTFPKALSKTWTVELSRCRMRRWGA